MKALNPLMIGGFEAISRRECSNVAQSMIQTCKVGRKWCEVYKQPVSFLFLILLTGLWSCNPDREKKQAGDSSDRT